MIFLIFLGSKLIDHSDVCIKTIPFDSNTLTYQIPSVDILINQVYVVI